MVTVSYYPLGAQIMTLVVPLGWFILIMIAMYFVFSRPHTVPGHQPISGARPVAPQPGGAAVAAAGFPPAAGGDTAAQNAADQAGAASSSDESASEQAPETGKSEGPE